jgi:putative PIN family toxin of toxin-antitoxin system
VRVVLDTNVLISGILFSGTPGEILIAWRNDDIQFALNSEIINEYFRVGVIFKSKFPGVEITPILNLIIAQSEIIDTGRLSVRVCDNPDDDKFVACVLASGSRVIISGDKHLLKLSGYEGIAIVTPRLFIEHYLKT